MKWLLDVGKMRTEDKRKTRQESTIDQSPRETWMQTKFTHVCWYACTEKIITETITIQNTMVYVMEKLPFFEIIQLENNEFVLFSFSIYLFKKLYS